MRIMTRLMLVIYISCMVKPSVAWNWKCTLCRWGASALITYHREGLNSKDALNMVTESCRLLRIYPGPVCKGMVNSVGGQLFKVLDMTKNTLTPGDICGMMIGPKCSEGASKPTSWSLDLPFLDQKPTCHNTYKYTRENETFKVIHLSDLHVQLNYTIGSPALCEYPICCQPDIVDNTSNLSESKSRARYWGEYSCDLPPWTLDKALDNVAETNKDAAYVILTGDLPAHDVWMQSKKANLNVVKVAVDSLKKHFPDILVLPAVGNHESYPVDTFPDPLIQGEPSTTWLYSSLSKYFSHWLGKEQQLTFSKAGYFSIQVKPGLRVISINNNFCNNLNVWLLPSPRDPSSQLTWLAGELLDAESKNETVHIISHIPPGFSDCLGSWSHQFARIVRRFCNTITGQFYGHTHFDEFSVLFMDNEDYTDREPVAVSYIGPSLTPLNGLNPAYRVYEVNRNNFQITDHTTFSVDLEKANFGKGLNFTKEYSARLGLELVDLSPVSWADLVTKFKTSPALWARFYKWYSRSGPRTNGHCDQKCKMDILCRLVTFDRDVTQDCMMIRKRTTKPYN